MRPTALFLSLTVLSLPAVPAAGQQADRRDRYDPEIVLNTGGRTGACDALRFSRYGRTLLAAGDDKVVRVWNVAADGKLSDADPAVLRWGLWRERRGII